MQKKHLRLFFILSVCALTLSFLLHALYVAARGIDVDFEPAGFDPSKETDHAARFSTLNERYKEQNGSLSADETAVRNIFEPFQEESEPAEPIVLRDIVFEPFVFMYMGFIERSAAEYIAQINWSSQTYFVREGDTFKEWTVTKVTKEKVVLINPTGEDIELPLQQKVFSKKPFARVLINRTGKEQKITIGDTVEGYKVLDITRDTVILSSNSGSLTITK
jgi:hypothetical protein